MIAIYPVLLVFGVNRGELKDFCPPPEDLEKCNCNSIDNVKIYCHNLLHPNELVVITSYLSDFKVRTFGLRYSVLKYWPKEIFHSFKFGELLISSSTVLGFEGDYAPYAFQGLENSLKLINLSNIYGMPSWRMDTIKELSALSYLVVKHTDLFQIIDQFPANLSIKTIDLSYNEINYMNPHTFNELTLLSHLRMSHNYIKWIDRMLLPNPAMELETIDFSYNYIKSIPDDFFLRMPRLKTANFARNMIQFLSPATFQPLTRGQNFHIHLEDNNIFCCIDVIYIVKAEYKRNLNITCNHPRLMRGKQLQTLSLNEMIKIKC